MEKIILGLDLGTNSIGWALIQQDFENKDGEILGIGSRIIPMSQDILDNFGAGKPSITQTAARTGYRSVRRLRERYLLRRDRLHRVLNVLHFLPQHYSSQIDFEKRLGKFKDETEPKLVYKNQLNQLKGKEELHFIFKNSFEEMLADFRKNQPQLLVNKHGEPALIPYDWTIYYLRKKALTQKIEKEELAWILLNFNQKRGYSQLRGEDEEDQTRTAQTRMYFDSQVITDILDKGSVYKGLKVIQIKLANGDSGKYFSKEIPNWIGQPKNIIATIDLDKEGNDKYEEDGSIKRRFSVPTEDDWDKKWKLVKIKTQNEIDKYIEILKNKNEIGTVGSFIYDALLQNPKQKIKGKLVRTIERKYYTEELKQILEKQIELQPEVFTDDLYSDCIQELYRNNEAHQSTLSSKGFVHLFLDDIIFYQRPLRSQKSSIGNCSLELRPDRDKEGVLLKDKNGEPILKPLKAIPKSNPYYQEFRVWQWLYNLKIYKKGDNEIEVTNQFISSNEDLETLFYFLMTKEKIDQKGILKYLFTNSVLKGKALTAEMAKYRWNYVYDAEKDESKEYPCNETGVLIRSRLQKVEGIANKFLTREIEQQLWHLIYSVTDKIEYEKALKSFAEKHKLDNETFVDAFKKFPPFKSEYGAFSEKAIKKLLPLMRAGKYWNESEISKNNALYFQNINSLLIKLNEKQEDISQKEKDKWDKSINTKLYEELSGFLDADIASFQGLRLHIAQYIVYGRHSEATLVGNWNSIDDLEQFLEDFKQHSLRNPIVEQVITETLRVVKDIWKQYGNGAKNFFDEIHIELGRDMKNPKDERERLSKQISENENTNMRIKYLIEELKNDASIENVRPFSHSQQDALKIYENGVLNSGIEIPDFVNETLKKFKESDAKKRPTTKEVNRYKLWLEQKYRSPYTGEMIPLSKLFTSDYEIEHIIPKSRFFDDSLSNKVICEAAVNKLKDNQIGLAFIKKHRGEKVPIGFGKTVQIFTEDAYTEFVSEHYAKNRSKRNKLMLEDVPEKMIERQLNDTRYISKYISGLLSNLVRSETNDDGLNSKNIIPGNGKITNELKQDWGLNDVWNELILPRFERLNELTGETHFTAWNENHQKFLPTVPLELSKGFSKKRIDHRHHAMDALIIACATRDHVNLLNNQAAQADLKRYDLQHKLRRKEPYFNEKENRQKDAFKEFIKPWETFTQDARNALESIVVSFKQNLRVINKATNYYDSYKDENGNIRIGKDGKAEKGKLEQIGLNWAIRKSMHKDTVSGKVDLPWYKVPKGKLLSATRKTLDTSFDIKGIESITDTGIQKILKNYLAAKDNNSEIAFSAEGIEELNKNIAFYNDGKLHQQIFKVRVYELGSKFSLGEKGNRNAKYVEAAKGTNLFFAVYWDGKKKKRSYETIPLNVILEHQKWRATLAKEEQKQTPMIPINLENGKFLFSLSPNDLVYVPTEEELENIEGIDFGNLNKEQSENIYKVVSFSGSQLFFVQQNVAITIVNKMEFSPLNKMERAINGTMIKECCIKLSIDKLGEIFKA